MSVNCVRVRSDALACHWQPLWPYDLLSTYIPPTPRAVLRSTFLRFCRQSRSARRLRRATAAVGSEMLRTEVRRSRFGACTISGLNSASTAGSTGSGVPEPPPPGARSRLRLRRSVALGLSSCQVQRNVDIVVHLFDQHFLLLHSREAGRVGWSTHGVSSSTIISLTPPALSSRRPRRPYLYCPR